MLHYGEIAPKGSTAAALPYLNEEEGEKCKSSSCKFAQSARCYTTYTMYSIKEESGVETSRTTPPFLPFSLDPAPSDRSCKNTSRCFSLFFSFFFFFFYLFLELYVPPPPYVCVSGLYASFPQAIPASSQATQYNTDDLLDCTTAYRLHTHTYIRTHTVKMSPPPPPPSSSSSQRAITLR